MRDTPLKRSVVVNPLGEGQNRGRGLYHKPRALAKKVCYLRHRMFPVPLIGILSESVRSRNIIYSRRSGSRKGTSVFARQGSVRTPDFLRASRIVGERVLSSSFASAHSCSTIRSCSVWICERKSSSSCWLTPPDVALPARDCCSRRRKLESIEYNRCSN